MQAPDSDANALRAEDCDPHTLDLLANYLARRLTYYRRMNDGPLTPLDTARVRGAIQECVHLGDLVKPKIIPRGQGTVEATVESLDLDLDRSIRLATE